MSNKYNKQSRRQFLVSASGFTLALPVLPSLLSKEAFASFTTGPKRFINFGFGNNMMRSKYLNPALAQNPTGTNGAKELRLSTYSGNIGEAYDHAMYKKLQSAGLLTMVGGLDCMAYGSGHGRASSTTAQSSLSHNGTFYESIDSFLEQSRVLYPDSTPGEILKAVRCDSSGIRMVNRSGDLEKSNFASVAGYNDPKVLYNDLFSGFAAPTETPTSDKNLKYMAIQRIHDSYKSTRSSRRISSADKIRLEEHIAKLRDVELKLEKQDSFKLGCAIPDAPTGNTRYANYYNIKLDLYLDLMAMSVKCGLSNVLTHGFSGHAERASSISTLHPTQFLHNGIFHNDSAAFNNAQIADYYVAWKRFYLNKLAELFLPALDVEEGVTGRTYLDNSLVLISSESGIIDDGPCLLYTSPSPRD